MEQKRIPWLRIIILSAAGVAILAIIIIVALAVRQVNRGPFYLSKSFPSDGQAIDITANATFTFTFNKNIKPVNANQVTFNPSNQFTVSQSGATLNVLPQNGFGDTGTITLHNIESTDGYKITSQVIHFSVKSVDPNYANARYTTRKYPITRILPHYSDDATWAVHVPGDGDFISPPSGYATPFYIYVDTVLDDSDLRLPVDQQHQILDQMRAAALKYITDSGFKLEDYPFYYTDPYLQATYGTTQPRQPALPQN